MYHLRRSHGFWGQLQGSQEIPGLRWGACCQLHPCWWSMPKGLGRFEIARFRWESNRGREWRFDGSAWQHQRDFVTESCGRNGNQVLEQSRFQCHWGSCQEIRAFHSSTNTEFQEGTWFLEGFPVDARVFWGSFRFGLCEQIVWCIWCQPARVSCSSPCSSPDSWVWTLACDFRGLVILNSKRHSCGEKLWSQKSCSKLLCEVDPDFNWSFFDELWLWTSTPRSPEGHVVAISPGHQVTWRNHQAPNLEMVFILFNPLIYIDLYRAFPVKLGIGVFFCFLHSIGSSTSCCHRFHFTRFHRVFTVFLMVKCPGFRQDHHTWDMENSALFGIFWSQRIRFVGGETNHFFDAEQQGFLLCKVTMFFAIYVFKTCLMKAILWGDHLVYPCVIKKIGSSVCQSSCLTLWQFYI